MCVSCSDDNEKLTGTWVLDRVENGGEGAWQAMKIIELKKDGTGNMDWLNVTWRAENNYLLVTYPEDHGTSAISYVLSGATLTLFFDRSNDISVIYNKK